MRLKQVKTGIRVYREQGLPGVARELLQKIAPENKHGDIALLRLDTDTYRSTKAELDHFYPKLVSGGILIIDDYGHAYGARRAVDEYLADPSRRLLLNRVNLTNRLAVKI